jgi:hypothetical protein
MILSAIISGLKFIKEFYFGRKPYYSFCKPYGSAASIFVRNDKQNENGQEAQRG